MPKASPFVFISYSRTDQGYARRLRRTLEERGVSVWIDDNIDFGSRWKHEIRKNLRNCNAFILLMTPRSEQSTWVEDELDLARRLKKKIFPILLEESLEEDAWWYIRSLEWIDVTSGALPKEEFFQSLGKVCPPKTTAPVLHPEERPRPPNPPSRQPRRPSTSIRVLSPSLAKVKDFALNRRNLLMGASLSGGLAIFRLFSSMLNGRQSPTKNDFGSDPRIRIDSSSSEEPDDSNASIDRADSASGSVVKVGILHSLSGTLAIIETTLVDAEELAIAEINAAGGVLGKQIVAVKEDGASDWPTFAEKAEKLISQDEVSAVFGCWTSASRKAVLPVFEEKDHMLWYPMQYEGQECSKNIFYTGAAPNQQIEPAVDWLLENKGKGFFLVGSDYVFPRTVNTIIKEKLRENGGTTVGEDYLPLGNTELTPIVNKIKQALPNGGVIFNSLIGDSNVSFFRQMKSAGMGPDKYPVMSVSIAEEEVRQIGPEFLEGHYAAWNYFQTIESPANEKWVSDFKAKYGDDRVTNDPMEAAYISVYLWAQAVEKAGTTDIPAVREAAYGQVFEAPGGTVTMQPNHHISKTVRIGQIRADGLFDIVSATDSPVDPIPWNQYVPDTNGYACDWSDAAKGGKYKI